MKDRCKLPLIGCILSAVVLSFTASCDWGCTLGPISRKQAQPAEASVAFHVGGLKKTDSGAT